jgi:hypothetical protein
MLEEYERNRNGSHSFGASAEVVDAGQSSEPTISEQARARLDQYLRDPHQYRDPRMRELLVSVINPGCVGSSRLD